MTHNSRILATPLGQKGRLLRVDHPIDLAQWRQIVIECRPPLSTTHARRSLCAASPNTRQAESCLQGSKK